MKKYFLLFLCAVAPIFPASAATVYCVDKLVDANFGPSTSGLVNALLQVESGPAGSEHHIRLKQGTYTLSSDLLVQLESSKASKLVFLQGGFSKAGTCLAEDQTLNPANTVVNGQGQHALAFYIPFYFGDPAYQGGLWNWVLIEGITFSSMPFVQVANWCQSSNGAGGTNYCGGVATLKILQNRFINAPLSLSASGFGKAVVSGNVFSESPLEFSVRPDVDNAISFNTFFDSGCNPVQIISTLGAGTFHHNIHKHGAGCGPALEISNLSAEAWGLSNNVLGEFPAGNGDFENLGGNITGALAADPGFVNAGSGDFRLRTSAPQSIAINAGKTVGEMVEAGLADQLPEPDLDGKARPIGQRFDLGAYESSVLGVAPLNVVNVNDAGAGSLREALLQSNSQAGTQTIQFNIPGSCPRLISLSSPLPDITGSVVIDGYSQPGSSPNSHLSAFNGTACITLTAPLLAPLDWGFRVPDTMAANGVGLTVKGISFTNFVAKEAAIGLLNGSGHVVTGNVFQGSGLAGGSKDGVRIDTGGSVTIGGGGVADRNVFKDIQDNAVEITGGAGQVIVRNNLIGLAEDGETARPGPRGVFVLSGANITVSHNRIAAATSAGVRLDGVASGVKIHANVFGESASGLKPPSLRNFNAISVGGTPGHQIGSPSVASLANIITNSKQAGISMSGAGATGVRIGRNRIVDNGLEFPALGVDFSAVGRQANDHGDVDTGPNNLQNWALLTTATVNADGARAVSGTLATAGGQDYRIDIYRSPNCPAEPRGDAAHWVGSMDPITPVSSSPMPFSIAISGTGAPGFLTAITTSAAGDSSEISPCLQEPATAPTAPTISAQSFVMPYGAMQSTLLGTVIAADDEGADQLEFTITSGNAAGAFAMIADTGGLVLVDPALVPALPHALTVSVTDSDGFTSSAVVTVLSATLFCDGFEAPDPGCAP